MLKYRMNYIWRLFATNLSFFLFGIGGLFISLVLFPLIHMFARLFFLGREWAHRRCQFIIHLGFRLFIEFMHVFGILTYDIRGAEKLKNLSGTLIIANHPTLLDVVFIVSMVPEALCLVKKGAWSNPFLRGIMWGAGYIKSDDPMLLLQDCVKSIESGNNLVIFPEATRTVQGKPMKLRRGAAAVISKCAKPVVPLTITCNPPTLSKSDLWFMPAAHKMHFLIMVHDTYNPEPEIIDTDQLGLSNRNINRVLEKLFLEGIKLHG